MWQRFLLSVTVLLAACGSNSGATTADAESDAGTDAAMADAAADSGSDAVLTDTLTDTVADAGDDAAQCLPQFAPCLTGFGAPLCCPPHTCMNMGNGPACQSEGPDVQPPDMTPDAGPDEVTQTDATVTCKDGGDDVIPAPMCSGSGPAFFPTFSKQCSADSDCAVAFHQINCCGTQVAWGIQACEMGAFSTSETQCESQYPGCGCAQFMTQAEDGYSSFTNSDFAAKCDAGVCRSFVKNAKADCTAQGLQSPKPVKACKDVTDCDFSMLTVDCCGSMQFVGIAKFAKAAYDVEQKKCAATMSVCDCMPKPTTLEDGKPLTTNMVPLACVSGACISTYGTP